MSESLSGYSRTCTWLTATVYLALCVDSSTILGQQVPVTKPAEAGHNASSQLFKKTALPFLKQYCLRCHNEQNRESGIRVDQFNGQLAEATLALWEEIAEQLEMADMPPQGRTTTDNCSADADGSLDQ